MPLLQSVQPSNQLHFPIVPTHPLIKHDYILVAHTLLVGNYNPRRPAERVSRPSNLIKSGAHSFPANQGKGVKMVREREQSGKGIKRDRSSVDQQLVPPTQSGYLSQSERYIDGPQASGM